MPRLLIQRPGREQRVYELPEGRTVQIGRAQTSDVVLPDSNISRLHATITCTKPGHWVVEDRNSANGIQVNGAEAHNHTLKNGDVITIGDFTLRFEVLDTQDVRRAGSTDLPSRLTLVMSRKEVEMALRHAGAAPTPWSAAQERAGAERRKSGEDRRHGGAERLSSLEHENQLLTLLYQVSRALGELATVDEVVERVLELVLQIEGAERGYAMLLSEKGDLMPAVIRYRQEQDVSKAPQMILSQSIIRSVLDGGEPLLVQDARADERFVASQSIALSGMQSGMCAPLRTQEKTFGLLYVDNLNKRGMFTQEDLNVFAVIASQAGLAIDHVRARKEVAQQIIHRTALERFLSPGIAKKVAAEASELKVGGENQKITVLFADIRGFTSLAEAMRPEDVVELLNQFFQAMSDVIFDHGGTLDKYLGDGLMALFGAPFAAENDALRAVQAAIRMQATLAELNRTSERAPLQIGIGINTGPAIVGFMGTSRRLDYTALGDTVNTASRLTAAAEPGQVLVSAATHEELHGTMNPRMLPPIRVKGKAAPLKVFEIPWAPDRS